MHALPRENNWIMSKVFFNNKYNQDHLQRNWMSQIIVGTSTRVISPHKKDLTPTPRQTACPKTRTSCQNCYSAWHAGAKNDAWMSKVLIQVANGKNRVQVAPGFSAPLPGEYFPVSCLQLFHTIFAAFGSSRCSSILWQCFGGVLARFRFMFLCFKFLGECRLLGLGCRFRIYVKVWV